MIQQWCVSAFYFSSKRVSRENTFWTWLRVDCKNKTSSFIGWTNSESTNDTHSFILHLLCFVEISDAFIHVQGLMTYRDVKYDERPYWLGQFQIGQWHAFFHLAFALLCWNKWHVYTCSRVDDVQTLQVRRASLLVRSIPNRPMTRILSFCICFALLK